MAALAAEAFAKLSANRTPRYGGKLLLADIRRVFAEAAVERIFSAGADQDQGTGLTPFPFPACRPISPAHPARPPMRAPASMARAHRVVADCVVADC